MLGPNTLEKDFTDSPPFLFPFLEIKAYFWGGFSQCDLWLKHIFFWRNKNIVVSWKGPMAWTKEYTELTKVLKMYCQNLHIKEGSTVCSSLWGSEPSVVFSLPQASQVVYDACIVLSSHNAFDHRRWIFTFTHHLTRRWQLWLETSVATNPDAPMLVQSADSISKKGCSNPLYLVFIVTFLFI